MANKLYDENSVKAVADAIRAKNGSTEQYKLADMPQAIENIQSIPEGNCWDYIDSFKISPFAQTGEILNVVIPKYVTALNRTFACTYATQGGQYKTVIISKLDEAEYPVTAMTTMFDYNYRVGNVYLNIDTSKVTSFQWFIGNYIQNIYGDFDLSSATNLSGAFTGQHLRIITFKPETIHISITFYNASHLTDESIQSIINGLAQAETAQTLTLHSTVKAKLTEEQIAAINEKGWTLA